MRPPTSCSNGDLTGLPRRPCKRPYQNVTYGICSVYVQTRRHSLDFFFAIQACYRGATKMLATAARISAFLDVLGLPRECDPSEARVLISLQMNYSAPFNRATLL